MSCTTQNTGRSVTDGTTKVKQGIYNPPLGSLTEPYNTTTFPGFNCIDRLDITLLSAAVPGGSATVSVRLDDVSYVAYVKQ